MRVDVDSAAITANVRALRAIIGVPVCGVVKADGYGHGALRSATAMLDGGAAMLGVVDLQEALALRRAGIDAPLLAWLHGAGTDFRVAAAHEIQVAVSSIAQLEAAAAAGATIHLKLDTGLGRNGIARGDRARAIARAIELARGGARIRGAMSHLAGSSREADLAQVADFAAALEQAAPLGLEVRHLANSQGALALPEARFDLVRIGMAAYGIDPNGPAGGDGAAAASLGLVPAMRVTAAFVDGVASCGLDDGLLPALGAPVRIGGETARVVAIDPCRLRIEPALTGEGVLWGDPATGDPSADAWAAAAGTIGYETVTRMAAARRGSAAAADAGTAVTADAATAPRRVLELGLDGEPQRLLGEVIGVKRAEAGLGISYGGEYVTPGETTLALVGLGYADGVTRSASGRPAVLAGEAHPIRGRVAMDQVVLDIGDRLASVGDPVELAHASAPELTGMIGARVAVELAGSIADADEMESLGFAIGARLRAGDAVLLIGPLGAGKTTLTRGIGAALGARGTVQSPTFVLARTHRTAAGPALQHVDAYRLLTDDDEEAELDDLDLDLEGAITVAEWGAPLEHALESWLRVEIERPVAGDDDDGDGDVSPRTVRLSGHGPAWPAGRVRGLAADRAADDDERQERA
ncbi:tRNA threonylcarbamoyl adenosine modification protein YjeE/alanine racemase,TIGR00492 [Agrococcus baldri]|uniref:tRNA threonylcarbamoyl adenosine modification protein YjeE/alanine racemase,TIGR00492 n=1 Tax=Agrococcus baldri TaxID=153730 RepID=A0AA94KYU4_9MICO|nr:tRNA (adenosine(37)-N6)-threonylcarbamoyltransferase complex ATPase subunit type 1 TsaE [Agrococcus baldri]SFS02500.1 tRNA threonylcarbamoyl adenosine modification protein YjeE/alanine racemase,TIGR00492 [Agrococcus baldri]